MREDIEELKQLLGKRTGINENDKYGCTLLHYACQKNDVELVQFLIKNGAEITHLDNNEISPFDISIEQGYAEITELFVTNDPSLNKNDKLLTALHTAAALGHKKIVELLSKAGWELNQRDESKRTALHWAAQENYLDIIELLLDKGAYIDSMDEEGFTPLSIAVGEGYSVLVKYLLDRGANFNLKTIFNDSTPLHIACAWDRYEIVVLLIDKNANLEAKDKEGFTPIFYAVTYGYYELVKLLILKGADLKAYNNKNESLLDVAILNGDEDMISLLTDVSPVGYA